MRDRRYRSPTSLCVYSESGTRRSAAGAPASSVHRTGVRWRHSGFPRANFRRSCATAVVFSGLARVQWQAVKPVTEKRCTGSPGRPFGMCRFSRTNAKSGFDTVEKRHRWVATYVGLIRVKFIRSYAYCRRKTIYRLWITNKKLIKKIK